MLIVDQLEEVWTACEDEGERAAFLDMLAGLVADGGSPIVLVLVSGPTTSTGWPTSPRSPRPPATTPSWSAPRPPTTCAAPCSTRPPGPGSTLDEGLVDAVVTDAGAEPGLLPLLSTSLRRLWERREGGG